MTISDYVADLRAATPSNAAELAVMDQDALRQTLDSMSETMITSLRRQLKASRQHLTVLSDSAALKSPYTNVKIKREALHSVTGRMAAAQSGYLAQKRQRFIGLTAKLEAMSPLKVLTRGYSMVQSDDGTTIRSIKQVSTNSNIAVTVSDGTISASVKAVKENQL